MFTLEDITSLATYIERRHNSRYPKNTAEFITLDVDAFNNVLTVRDGDGALRIIKSNDGYAELRDDLKTSAVTAFIALDWCESYNRMYQAIINENNRQAGKAA